MYASNPGHLIFLISPSHIRLAKEYGILSKLICLVLLAPVGSTVGWVKGKRGWQVVLIDRDPNSSPVISLLIEKNHAGEETRAQEEGSAGGWG